MSNYLIRFEYTVRTNCQMTRSLLQVDDGYGRLYSSNPAYHCCLIPQCLSSNRSANCQCLGAERATCTSDDGRVNMTIISSVNGKDWTHVKTVWRGPSGYSSLQVLPASMAMGPRPSGLGLLWEAWGNFTQRDSPAIRYIVIDINHLDGHETWNTHKPASVVKTDDDDDDDDACSSEDQCLGHHPAAPAGSAPRCLAGSSGAFCVTDHLPHNATCACGFELCNRTVVPPALAGKKQLLVIGDSISFGWRSRVATNLSQDSWQLVHAGDHPNEGYGGTDNNGNTNWISHCLWSNNGGGWLTEDPERWDMIITNAGLHDLAKDNQHINLTIYSTLLEQIFETLARQMPSARLLWLSTTPAPTNPPTPLFPERLQSSVIQYNSAAAAVMSKAKVKTCDLFEAVTAACGGPVYSSCPAIQKVGGIHFESSGWDLLAATVAGCVRESATERTSRAP